MTETEPHLDTAPSIAQRMREYLADGKQPHGDQVIDLDTGRSATSEQGDPAVAAAAERMRAMLRTSMGAPK